MTMKKRSIITARAPLITMPVDWQEALGVLFKGGTIDGPKNCWHIAVDGMYLQVIVFDQRLDRDEIQEASRYDIEADNSGVDWLDQHQSHAVIAIEGTDMFEMKLLGGQIAQVLGAQAILWDDNSYIRPGVMSRIADGTLPEVFTIFSVTAWEDEYETYGFIAQGLEHILNGWLVMPVMTKETHAYSRTLARITVVAATLAEQGLDGNTVVNDPTEDEQTLSIIRQDNLIYIVVNSPDTIDEKTS